MTDYNVLVAQWAQEKLLCAPLAVDAASAAQVWDATVALREKFSDLKDPTKIDGIVEAWASDSFSNAPIANNTAAGNQVRAAIADLRVRLGAVAPPHPQLELELPLPPAQPAPISDKETEE